MSVFSSQPSTRQRSLVSERGGFLWLVLPAVLLAEYLFTTFAIDLQPLAERADWLGALASIGTTGPILLAIVTATLVIGGPPLLADLRRTLGTAPAAQRPLPRCIALVAVHLAAFAVFFALTVDLSRSNEQSAPDPLLFICAWLGSGLVAVLALATALLPLGAILPVVRRSGGALFLGVTLGLLAWLGGVATVRLWEPLGSVTVRAVARILHLVGPTSWWRSAVEAPEAGFMLEFDGFSVIIDPPCSGYEGIGLLTILLGAYIWVFRSSLRFPHVLALIPIGIAVSWFANVVRIVTLMLVGARWSAEIAVGGFHSKAGWVLFCAISLGLVALMRRSTLLASVMYDPRPTWNPTAAYLAPLLVLVGAHMITGLFSAGFPLFYPIAGMAGAIALWWYRRDYSERLRPSWSWEACLMGIGAFGLWIAMRPATDPAVVVVWREELAAFPASAAALWLGLRALGSVVVVPLAEELAFRGYLLRRLVSADFTSVSLSQFAWIPFLASSTAFGLLHERWLAGLLTGMLFAIAQYWRGRIGDAVLAHGITNLLVAIYAICWQEWSLSDVTHRVACSPSMA